MIPSTEKAFRAGKDPRLPFYTITASLDLAGKYDGTYYFNYDNDFSYASARDYNRYVQVDENHILSEVIVYSNPPIVATDAQNPPEFLIGGALPNAPMSPVVVPWAAPPGSAPVNPPEFVGASLTTEEVNGGSINYYGHEGGHFPYFENLESKEDLSSRYKYLAVTINPDSLANSTADGPRVPTRMTRRQRVQFRGLPTGGDISVAEGRISVVLKVYPKAQ